MGMPQSWSESQPEIAREAPLLGQHTVELLADYGFGQDEIRALVATNAAIDGASGDRSKRK